MRTAVILMLVLGCPFPALAGSPDPCSQAEQFEKAGNHEAAFLTWMGVEGAEYRAIRLARRDPARYLHLLGRIGPEVPAWRSRLIAGDLLLGLGKTAQALRFYRGVAGHFAGTNRYPVEPTRKLSHAVRPFAIGPGSHRDNWLIRRFIAMDQMEDAAREFERLRVIHQPPHGRPFSPSALLFTLDYAFFLLRTDDDEKAYAELCAPVLVMDMDRLRGRSPGLTWKKYIRLSLGILKEAGRADLLVAAVEEQVDLDEVRALRVLAEIRRQQERSEEACALELRYLREADLPELSRRYRQGLAFEAVGRIADAVRAYEQTLAAPWSVPVLPDHEPGGSGSVPSQRDSPRF